MPEREETTYIFGSISNNEPYHEIRYNCFYGFDEIFMERGGRFDINDSTNVYADPRFVSLDNMDLNLLPDSPCIDAGDPDFPEDPDGTRADMGAFYFHQNHVRGNVNDHALNDYKLFNAYPNPFNTTTTISYGLLHPGHVSLQVYNMSGQQIGTLFEGYKQTGIHTTILTAYDLPSGLYFVRLKAPEQVFSQKVMLIR